MTPFTCHLCGATSNESWSGIIHSSRCPERPEHSGFPPKGSTPIHFNCDCDATPKIMGTDAHTIVIDDPGESQDEASLDWFNKTFETRRFESGAIRDSNEDKLDFESTFDPMTMESFAKFIHKHNKLPDGSMRPEDNWQKGIPKAEYMKSLFRHFMQAWKIHRGHKAYDNHGEVTMEDALNGIIFNARGYLYEILNGR
jgi:hypothetical protein